MSQSSFRPGDGVWHEHYGRGQVVEQWGSFLDTDPATGKALAVSGERVFDVDFQNHGRRSVSGCRLRPIAFAGVPPRTSVR